MVCTVKLEYGCVNFDMPKKKKKEEKPESTKKWYSLCVWHLVNGQAAIWNLGVGEMKNDQRMTQIFHTHNERHRNGTNSIDHKYSLIGRLNEPFGRKCTLTFLLHVI